MNYTKFTSSFKLEDGRETFGSISKATIEIDDDTVCAYYSVKSLVSNKEWENLLDSDLKEMNMTSFN